MKQEFRQLHNKMLQDIQRTMEADLGESQKADSCFWIAIDYWDKLRAIVKQSGFSDDNDEINFFRNVKPRFTCHIEYMRLLSQAMLFVPAGKEDAINYWTREIERYKEFYQKNIEFIVYYGRKDWHLNSIYFLRKNNKPDNNTSSNAYDADPNFCTSHDPIIRSYLAYTMYAKYARKKLLALTRNNTEKNEKKISQIPGSGQNKNEAA